ncbi:hypothetical protein VPH49_22130 [Pseudomonas luteola]|uniref:hypothetical protein n=1 Tax=Pseudomonas luteola TaxID=47886 RepID=UPI003A8B5243
MKRLHKRLRHYHMHFGFSLLFVALASRSYAEQDWPSLILCIVFALWDLYAWQKTKREARGDDEQHGQE